MRAERQERPAANRALSNVNYADDSNVPARSLESWITGSVYVDLTDAPEEKARMRLYAALREAPAGARVQVYVGPLAVNPAVLPVVWEYGAHVTIEVSGHAYAVRRWVDALRNGLGVVSS